MLKLYNAQRHKKLRLDLTSKTRAQAEDIGCILVKCLCATVQSSTNKPLARDMVHLGLESYLIKYYHSHHLSSTVVKDSFIISSFPFHLSSRGNESKQLF